LASKSKLGVNRKLGNETYTIAMCSTDKELLHIVAVVVHKLGCKRCFSGAQVIALKIVKA